MIGTDVLVEREQHLRTLRELFAEPSQSGSVVLVSGEAGFGKTSLINVAMDELDHRHRILTMASEPIGIPAAFAPLFDVIDDLPADLQDDIRSGSGRMPVYAGMLDLLKNDRIVLVMEDVHWADEATLGLARYLGRRVSATESTLIVSYRSEDVEVNPPLRLVVADVGPMSIRIDLLAISRSGVEEMVVGTGLDADDVYEATMGSPFFIEEVIRHPEDELPATIQNAVLSKAAQLPQDAVDFLNFVALSPDGVAVDSLAELGDSGGAFTDLAFAYRLLVAEKAHVSCRHELIRQSLVQTLAPASKQRLHRRWLDWLEGRETSSPDVARLAYHSIGSGQKEKAARYSLAAAHKAATAGAHRQAAFHYANAVGFADVIETEVLNDVLLAAAEEHNYINAFETAIELSRRRLALVDSAVDVAKARAWVSFFEGRLNNWAVAREEAEAAAEVLEEMGDSKELAVALSMLAFLHKLDGSLASAAAIGAEALRVARACDFPEMQIHAATTLGWARFDLGDPDGFGQVESAAALAIDVGGGEFGARALNLLGLMELESGRIVESTKWFEELLEYATAQELDAWYIAATVTLATLSVSVGLWDDADAYLETVAGQRTCFSTEGEMLTTAARLRMRRGDPGALDLVDAVFGHLDDHPDYYTRIEICLVGLEAAWMGVVPPDRVASVHADVLDTLHNGDGFNADQVAFWSSRLGWSVPTVDFEGPAALEIVGRPADAAAEWERRGHPIEASIAHAIAPDADLGEVFAILSSLGAEGVARGLRKELARRGVKGIPRGERGSTRDNPAGLTSRETEVLELVTWGLTNAEIADELFISHKTAGHHVSSILAKLNVANRGQAAAAAVANGWVGVAQK